MYISNLWTKRVIGLLFVFCLVIVFFKFVLPMKQEEPNSKIVKPEVQRTITKVLPDNPNTKGIMATIKSKRVTTAAPPPSSSPKSIRRPVIVLKSIENKEDVSPGPVQGPVRDVRWERERVSSLLQVVGSHYGRAQRDPKYYETMVKFARKIFEEFPDSEEVIGVRQLLRKVPVEYLKKYGVTDKELGISE